VPPSVTPNLTASPTTTVSVTPSLTASPTTTVSATPCTVQFRDVAAADYFYAAVQALACRGAVSGYSDGSFRPYAETSRAQLAKIVTLGFVLPLQTPPAGATFADVPSDTVFWPYVETLAARGIVSGYACGSSAAEPCNAQHQHITDPAWRCGATS
ncbi:MAG: S-layer homology domain-containing protein, partial [Chloroflexota bacterium]|nr:S-layer homology domain-containing protein [Chloroflexota bacterium]